MKAYVLIALDQEDQICLIELHTSLDVIKDRICQIEGRSVAWSEINNSLPVNFEGCILQVEAITNWYLVVEREIVE